MSAIFASSNVMTSSVIMSDVAGSELVVVIDWFEELRLTDDKPELHALGVDAAESLPSGACRAAVIRRYVSASDGSWSILVVRKK